MEEESYLGLEREKNLEVNIGSEISSKGSTIHVRLLQIMSEHGIMVRTKHG